MTVSEKNDIPEFSLFLACLVFKNLTAVQKIGQNKFYELIWEGSENHFDRPICLERFGKSAPAREILDSPYSKMDNFEPYLSISLMIMRSFSNVLRTNSPYENHKHLKRRKIHLNFLKKKSAKLTYEGNH